MFVSVCWFVCPSVCGQNHSKRCGCIFATFCEGVDLGTGNNRLDFRGGSGYAIFWHFARLTLRTVRVKRHCGNNDSRLRGLSLHYSQSKTELINNVKRMKCVGASREVLQSWWSQPM